MEQKRTALSVELTERQSHALNELAGDSGVNAEAIIAAWVNQAVLAVAARNEATERGQTDEEVGEAGWRAIFAPLVLPPFSANPDDLRQVAGKFLKMASDLEGAAKEGSGSQADIWYDSEGDYLEVNFKDEPGYFRETENDHVMEKVDTKGNLLGFSILGARSLEEPLQAALP